MDVSVPKSPCPLILLPLLLFSQLFHLSLSSDLQFPPTEVQPHEKKILHQIKKHFGKNSQIWTSLTECCVYTCYEKPLGCDEDGHVIKLALTSSHNMSGPIPAAVGDLPYLQELAFSGPGFTGPIPPVIGKLSNLRFLFITNTSMTGVIPDSVGRLKNLITLMISNNRLMKSRLPKALSQLSSVSTIDLSSNSFSGQIPDIFSHMSSLGIVLLQSNRFSGPIPSSLGRLVNLQSLDLSHNQLTGPIPTSFGNFKDISYLALNDNKLNGSLPKVMVGGRVWTFNAFNNQLTDASNLFYTSNVDVIAVDLSNNHLKFDLSKAKFSDNLNSLNISHNMIYGSIPKGLGQNQRYLSSVDVSYNRLCGPIPASLVSKRQLSPANFAHNKCLCGAPLRPCK